MRRLVLVLAAALLLLAGCGQAGPVPAAPPPADTAAVTGTARVEITFYAGLDNDPLGSSDIAHPNGRHETAGGTGTYDDPVTLATDPDELPVGTLVYVPVLQKYFVMEDDCEGCIDEWQKSRHGHVDLWVSPTTDPAVLRCEATLTPDGPTEIEINPPAGRTVDTRPLYDAASGTCWART